MSVPKTLDLDSQNVNKGYIRSSYGKLKCVLLSGWWERPALGKLRTCDNWLCQLLLCHAYSPRSTWNVLSKSPPQTHALPSHFSSLIIRANKRLRFYNSRRTRRTLRTHRSGSNSKLRQRQNYKNSHFSTQDPESNLEVWLQSYPLLLAIFAAILAEEDGKRLLTASPTSTRWPARPFLVWPPSALQPHLRPLSTVFSAFPSYQTVSASSSLNSSSRSRHMALSLFGSSAWPPPDHPLSFD